MLIAIYLAFGVGLALVAIVFQRLRGLRQDVADPDEEKLRAFRRAGRRSAGELREGETAKVVGRVIAGGETLEAPLSGRPCVAWQLRIYDRRRGGSRQLADERRVVGFTLRDGTVEAAVEPGAALVLGTTGLLKLTLGDLGLHAGRVARVLAERAIEVPPDSLELLEAAVAADGGVTCLGMVRMRDNRPALTPLVLNEER